MTLATMRMTMFFATDNYTWTESHWLLGVSSYAAAEPPAISIATARCGILAEYSTMQAVRLTNLALPRTSFYLPGFSFPGDTGRFQVAPDGVLADRPYSALNIQFTGIDGTESRGYLSGIPDGLIGEGASSDRGIYALGIWGSALYNYIGSLLPLQAGALGINGAAYRRLDYSAVQNVAAVTMPGVPGNEIAVTFPAQLTFIPNTPPAIVFKGFQKVNTRLPMLHGTYYVDTNPTLFPVAPPWTYFLQNTANISLANIKKKGVGSGLLYTYIQYLNGTVVSATHRKRGASALAPRGRSRTRV